MHDNSLISTRRNSNMELLRIVAMLMIVVYHIFRHCLYAQLTDGNIIAARGTDYFCCPEFSKRLMLLAAIAPLGNVGNDIFMLVSGFFMSSNEGGQIDLTKISKKIFSQFLFSCLTLTIMSIMMYVFFYFVLGHKVYITLVSLKDVNEQYWYVGYYFLVIVLARIFLNDFLAKLEKKQYLMFTASMFALMQFVWSRSLVSNISDGLEILCTGIFLYSLGGYIRKYNPFDSLKTWALIAAIIVLFATVLLNFYVTTTDKIILYNFEGSQRFIQSVPLYKDYEFIPVCMGVAIFELFRRMKTSKSKVINFFGAATFMIYLLHDSSFFYVLWDKKDWIGALHNNMADFAVSYLLWVLGLFLFGALMYFVFQILIRLANKCRPFVTKQEQPRR